MFIVFIYTLKYNNYFEVWPVIKKDNIRLMWDEINFVEPKGFFTIPKSTILNDKKEYDPKVLLETGKLYMTSRAKSSGYQIGQSGK